MKEKVFGLVRHILSAAGALLVAKGYIDDSLVQEAIGGIMALVAVGWSIGSK
jgi:hypothetical protein